MGYSQSEWEKLRDDLRALAAGGDAMPGEDTGFGRKFEVDGILVASSGRFTEVRTVWLVANEGAAPRFVTAYPR